MRKSLTATLLLVLILLPSGCRKEQKHVEVYTDIPEAVILTDLFNSSQSEYTAHLRFISGDQETDMNLAEQDILLTSDLYAEEYKSRLQNLNFLRDTAFVRQLYPELKAAGLYGTELRVIPLSAEIPVVYTGEDFSGDLKGLRIITREELEALSESHNRESDGNWTHLGFSPLWSDSFLFAYISSLTDSYQTLLTDPGPARNAIAGELEEWIVRQNGGIEKDRNFDRKYRYIPDYRLIAEKRILFSLSDLSEYMLWPDSITGSLEFRYLAPEGKILPRNITSIGIPANSPNPEGAETFLRWLLEEQTWRRYLDSNIRYRDEAFGILNGISACYPLNENLLTEYYPELTGWIPTPGDFGRIPRIPEQWNRISRELLLPHLKEVLADTAEPEDLPDEYRKWLLLNPDPWLP